MSIAGTTRAGAFSAQELDMLSTLLAEAGYATEENTLNAVHTRPDDIPLSFSQQRLWFLDQFDPGNHAYNIFAALQLHGELDIAALQRSLNEIVRRHESLRTNFDVGADGQPRQVIHAPTAVELPIEDLRDLPAAAQETVVLQRAFQEARRPFDLRTGPLVRTTLLQLGAYEYVLLLTMHHIIADGWSATVLVQELGAFYAAFRNKWPSPLPELPIQYVDYTLWQHQWLQSEAVDQQLAYWSEKLAGPLPRLELPTDHPRPAVQTFRGAKLPFVLPRELTNNIKVLSQSESATLFMTLLAAFDTLLSRYTSLDDILVGTPIANRTRAETEGLIGFFLNMLVIRTDLSGQPTFRQLLQRVREDALGAFAHQDVPFEKLMETLQPDRSLSHSPLFQVMFILQNVPTRPLQLPGLTVSLRDVESGAAKYDLTLSLMEGEQGLHGWFEYNVDLFDAPTIARMAEHYHTLLVHAVSDPDQPIATLPILPHDERTRILSTWNATTTTYPHDRCIHHLIAEQTQRTPDAIALIFEDQSLTYSELEQRANQLAHVLQSHGIGPDVPVGVYMERSLNLVISLLAIHKAGGAYLPLDPTYPAERLSFMLMDTGAPVLLTQQQLLPTLPAHQSEVICVDSDWPMIATYPTDPPPDIVTPANLAYIIYTSGSTGKPKGVMVGHGNVVNFFASMDSRITGEKPGTWLAVTSISFDISVLELFWTLARGFRVVVQAEHSHKTTQYSERDIAFSLFYFANDDGAVARDRYRLLLEGARFADQHGFEAVWTPERHFHSFGGLYPNPSVTSAAVAAVTERVHIRAGSVVLPLHHPVRVAEEWSVVDNLSNGRVGISFASGWHADDFVFAPDQYADRKNVMLRTIETVQRLWRGESLALRGGAGNDVATRILPRPVQAELPVWLTAAGNPDTFISAGERGFYLLTHLLGQSFEELATKIALYRDAWRRAGHSGSGRVTLMLHTFIGDDPVAVRETVRAPFCNYLRSSVGLISNLARSMGRDIGAADFTDDDMEALLAYGFERYFETSGLFGTPETCEAMIERIKAVDVDEIACLIDFGIDADTVIAGLEKLDRLRQRSAGRKSNADYSIPKQIERHRVSHMQCTPSMAQMLALASEGLAALAQLDHLMLGGEALPAPLVRALADHMTGDIQNMYGPTETTIWSTTHHVRDVASSVPIGRPIANTDIYIVDKQLQPTPIGTPGELLIGGNGVVRGYLHRPALTAERFIPHPFSARPGARLYRTGDLARYLPDGTIEFLGRMDYQVKIRGFRIELEEIETVIGLHPDVRQAVVTAEHYGAGDQRLIAYVLPIQPDRPIRDDLRDHVRATLPEYMVPSAFVVLSAFPMTANGKIDRKALHLPAHERIEQRSSFVAPETPAERLVAEIIGQVLGTTHIGVHDDFFTLGGHSLLAAQVVARLRQVFQVDLPLRSLFEQPTVAGVMNELARIWGDQDTVEEIASVFHELDELSDAEIEQLLEH